MPGGLRFKMMMKKQCIRVDLANEIHTQKLVELLNAYMEDEMGISKSMPANLGPKIIEGLKKHPAYLGFFVLVENNFAALANCNVNYSTWKAQSLINIHDFIVLPDFRKQGIGLFLLKEIENYARENNCCKVNLEVRHDNFKAQKLYQKAGFCECTPPMFFWENVIA